MPQLHIKPQYTSYSVSDFQEYVAVPTSGGLPVTRRDVIGGTARAEVMWRVNPQGYQYLLDFHEANRAANYEQFDIYLYMDEPELTLHKASFVAESFKLVSQQGDLYTVAAQLEVEPYDVVAGQDPLAGEGDDGDDGNAGEGEPGPGGGGAGYYPGSTPTAEMLFYDEFTVDGEVDGREPDAISFGGQTWSAAESETTTYSGSFGFDLSNPAAGTAGDVAEAEYGDRSAGLTSVYEWLAQWVWSLPPVYDPAVDILLMELTFGGEDDGSVFVVSIVFNDDEELQIYFAGITLAALPISTLVNTWTFSLSVKDASQILQVSDTHGGSVVIPVSRNLMSITDEARSFSYIKVKTGRKSKLERLAVYELESATPIFWDRFNGSERPLIQHRPDIAPSGFSWGYYDSFSGTYNPSSISLTGTGAATGDHPSSGYGVTATRPDSTPFGAVIEYDVIFKWRSPPFFSAGLYDTLLGLTVITLEASNENYAPGVPNLSVYKTEGETRMQGNGISGYAVISGYFPETIYDGVIKVRNNGITLDFMGVSAAQVVDMTTVPDSWRYLNSFYMSLANDSELQELKIVPRYIGTDLPSLPDENIILKDEFTDADISSGRESEVGEGTWSISPNAIISGGTITVPYINSFQPGGGASFEFDDHSNTSYTIEFTVIFGNFKRFVITINTAIVFGVGEDDFDANARVLVLGDEYPYPNNEAVDITTGVEYTGTLTLTPTNANAVFLGKNFNYTLSSPVELQYLTFNFDNSSTQSGSYLSRVEVRIP